MVWFRQHATSVQRANDEAPPEIPRPSTFAPDCARAQAPVARSHVFRVLQGAALALQLFALQHQWHGSAGARSGRDA